MRANSRMTYGEAHYIVSQHINLEGGVFKSVPLPYHSQRMNRKDATAYYKQKCRDAFNILGIVEKVEICELEINLPIIFKKVRKRTEVMLRKEARKINNLCMEEVA